MRAINLGKGFRVKLDRSSGEARVKVERDPRAAKDVSALLRQRPGGSKRIRYVRRGTGLDRIQ